MGEGGARIGVLALQGGFEAHAKMLRRLGASVEEVRLPVDLEDLAGLVIPGGESTTILKGMESAGLVEPVRAFAAAGGAIFGTCAGMIVAAGDHLGLIDAGVRRNAFGRQLQSFEADLEVAGIGPEPLRGIFIRAPLVEHHGPGVEVLAEHDGHPVAIREGRVLATAFHPELGEDPRLHVKFLEIAAGAEPARLTRGER